MAIPSHIKFLPKLLPAAKLAYDHRDKAFTLYKKIQDWRRKDTLIIDKEPIDNTQQQIQQLHQMLIKRDDVIAEQSEILAKLANDLTELSALTDRLRIRSQWLLRGIYFTLAVILVRWIFSNFNQVAL